MKHPKFPDTWQVEKMARGVLDLAEERDYWRSLALKNEARLQEYDEDLDHQLQEAQDRAGKTLTALLDPNNGLTRAVRALERDPLKGYTE